MIKIPFRREKYFWKAWFEKGITLSHDFINPDGTWMSYQDLIQKYGIRTMHFRYLGILSIIKNIKKPQNIAMWIKRLSQK